MFHQILGEVTVLKETYLNKMTFVWNKEMLKTATRGKFTLCYEDTVGGLITCPFLCNLHRVFSRDEKRAGCRQIGGILHGRRRVHCHRRHSWATLHDLSMGSCRPRNLHSWGSEYGMEYNGRIYIYWRHNHLELNKNNATFLFS